MSETRNFVNLKEKDWIQNQTIFKLIDRLITHKHQIVEAIQNIGAVIPSEAFWKHEQLRYVHIFSFKSKEVASVREILQNSLDAGTTFLRIELHHVRLDCEQLLKLGLKCEKTKFEKICDVERNETATISKTFISFQDNGTWSKDAMNTFDICSKYFLYMNGSSKTNSPKGDGGFGVGRFIILFCSPLWFFTVLNMLVIGHYGNFLILCRSCLQVLKGADCEHCHSTDKEVQKGTTFFIHYDFEDEHLAVAQMKEYFLRYHNCPSVEIYLNNEIIPVAGKKSLIEKNEWFQVYKLDIPSNFPEYFVRTAQGLPMFSKILWNDHSEKGIFAIDLDAKVNYLYFDQARQSLGQEPGLLLDKFFSERDGNINSSDITLDIIVEIPGMNWQDLIPDQKNAPLSSSLSSSSPFSLSSSSPSISNNTPENESSIKVMAMPSSQELTPSSQFPRQSPIKCTYYFRNGKHMNNIEPKWKPGHSKDQVYLLILWVFYLKCAAEHIRFDNDDTYRTDDTSTKGHRTDDIKIGFIFDDSTVAMKHGRTFFLNPELMQKKLQNLKRSNKKNMIAYLISNAIHEVSHISSHDHDETFAMTQSDLIQDTFSTEFSQPFLLQKEREAWNISKAVFELYKKQVMQAAVKRLRENL